jgi:hypothetical protein
MLATAGMYAEDVSSNEVAILGKMCEAILTLAIVAWQRSWR